MCVSSGATAQIGPSSVVVRKCVCGVLVRAMEFEPSSGEQPEPTIFVGSNPSEPTTQSDCESGNDIWLWNDNYLQRGKRLFGLQMTRFRTLTFV